MPTMTGPKEYPGQAGGTLEGMKVSMDYGIITIPNARHSTDELKLLDMDQQPPQCPCGTPGPPLAKICEEE
eukprot:11570184-Alexandrium_andersonii.AAC.1